MIKKIIKDKRGEGYIDVCIVVLVCVMILVLAVSVLPVFIAKNQLDNYADELCREAEIVGQIGTETSNRASILSEQSGLEPNIKWTRTGKIQLNQEFTVTLTEKMDIGFGEFGSFPVTLTSKASGKSEVYWK